MARKYDNKSNYAQTETNRKFLDIYNPPLTSDTLDQRTTTILVQPKYNRRPDLLAFDLYGSARLWWVFAHYNRDILVDPIMDFISGTKIVAPKTFQATGNS